MRSVQTVTQVSGRSLGVTLELNCANIVPFGKSSVPRTQK